MARHINRLHHTVQGTLPESIGRYAAGEAYSGMEPLALLWVHIAFVDSMLTAYKTFVGPLSEAACEQYWQECCCYARLLGLTDATLPACYAAVQHYMREVLATGEIAIGPAAQFIAQKVLYPPVYWWRRPLWAIVRLITVGQLPAEIRQAYGLRWGPRQRVGFLMARGAGHLLRRLFPNALGRSSLVDFARCRARGEFCLAELRNGEYPHGRETRENTAGNHDRGNSGGNTPVPVVCSQRSSNDARASSVSPETNG